MPVGVPQLKGPGYICWRENGVPDVLLSDVGKSVR